MCGIVSFFRGELRTRKQPCVELRRQSQPSGTGWPAPLDVQDGRVGLGHAYNESQKEEKYIANLDSCLRP